MHGEIHDEVLSHSISAKHADVRRKVRAFISDNLLLGAYQELDDSTSLLDAGILDSTGAMELVSFIEDVFGLTIADREIVPENLDSVDCICALIARKQAA